MKKCTKCKKVLDEDCFYYNKTSTSFCLSCKKCQIERIMRLRKIYGTKEYWHRKYNLYKCSAKRRNHEFSLSLSEFKDILSSKKCGYCKRETKIGIDRIDNDIGYITGNCINCCIKCNLLKGKSSAQDLILFCKGYIKVKKSPLK